MTHAPGWTAVAENGCTGLVNPYQRCRTQNTVVMDGVNGRRCAEHAPPEAAELVARLQREQALERIEVEPQFAWLRPYLPNWIGSAAA